MHGDVLVANIIIADDHSVVRMAVRTLLEKAGHTVIKEVARGLDVISSIKKESPDLVILDIDLPQMDGFEVLRRLSKEENKYKVLVFSAMPANRFSSRCSRLGAVAYVSKNGEISDLISAIQVVLMGYSFFPITTSSSVDDNNEVTSESDLIQSLSARELVVLKYISRGYRIRNISDELMLSTKTISTYKARLLSKLKLENVADLIDMARRNGIN